MSRRNSRAAQDLLGQLLGLLGEGASLIHASEREWASITFAGARHRFVLELTEAALASRAVLRALAALPEHEFRLRGEIVADCSVTLGMPMPGADGRGTRLLVVEILTVAD